MTEADWESFVSALQTSPQDTSEAQSLAKRLRPPEYDRGDEVAVMVMVQQEPVVVETPVVVEEEDDGRYKYPEGSIGALFMAQREPRPPHIVKQDNAAWELMQFKAHRHPDEGIDDFVCRWDFDKSCEREVPLQREMGIDIQQMAKNVISGVQKRKALKLDYKQAAICKDLGITRKDFAKQCFDLFGIGWEEMDNEQRQEVIDCSLGGRRLGTTARAV